MSSPGTPPPSPFVRGTTDSSHVYELSAGTRRLIPDPQTLSFLLAGQSVRILTDAALAAIPLGVPLPSRKDGSLVTQKFAAPPPSIVVYFMANGQRRRIPDLDTQLGFVHGGSQFIQVELADLTAMPEGPALPTRKDGTLYQGAGKVFAYLMQNGQKLAFPDATTLRDAGHDFNTMVPITPADLSFIPDGKPFSTTSRFLSPPSAQVPLVLLPVRLETRIQNNELWLRVYPDDLHVNSFEPDLTADEQAARAAYLSLAQADTETRRAAFAALARQFGPARAAWITSAGPSSASKKEDWTLAPTTNVLPERWIVIGYLGNEPGQVIAVGPAIKDPLALGPVPGSSILTTDAGTKWVTDFDSAIQAGMAFRITLSAFQPRGFTRLLVLGLRTTLNPKDSAARLGELLQAHHYTDGLELLPLNTPTNNTEDVPSGLSTKDSDYAKLFALEQGPSLCPSRPTADGDRLARAINIAPETFAHVSGADGAQDEQARSMNTVLWPATWGYYLSQIVTGAVPNPDVMLPVARDHFADHVRARGHFPAVRIGRQPYGILPVCWSANWQSLEGRVLDAPLHRLLQQLRTIWGQSIFNVPRIPNSPDPEAALVSLLGMTPSSSSTIARGVIGPEYAFAYWSFVRSDLTAAWWSSLAQKTRVDNSNLATAMANTRLASATYVPWHRPLSDVLVGTDPGFVAQLDGLGWEKLVDATLPAPIPVLFLLLRHAALREYLDTALDLLTPANAVLASERIEAEMVGFTGVALRPTAWDLLRTELSNRGPVGALLDQSKTDATLPAFVAFWQAFARLAQFSADDLEAAAREVLDLASYRLDAWITSLAHFRLDQARAANPNGGIVLGAYGWLENTALQQPQPPSQGFVHAPSLNQSTTAAVLRSGYLAHLGGPQKPFEIDLSSARVRLALHLLDGIREGQPLGALLGYRLERTLHDTQLHDTQLDTLIQPLRNAFPLSAGSQLDVVDGLGLLRQFHTDQQKFWDAIHLSPTASPQGTGLNSAITLLFDALDSVADLTLSESVHQLTRGNTLRAGAVLDSIARGDSPPPEIDFVQTLRSGAALTYRLMTVAIGNSAPGWTVTPRAQAEPRLNAWAAALLGDPSLVRIRTHFVSADGSSLANVEVGLHQLALAPIDLLSFPETAGIAGELADRIRRVVGQTRPASVPPDAQVEIVPERDPAWTPQTIGIAEWLGLLQAITRMTGGARPIEPGDLVVQGDPAGAIDTDELKSRADTAETQLRAALAALTSPTGQDVALLGAAAFGVAGVVPALDPSTWPPQIAAASADLSSRAQALDRLATGFVRGGASPDSLRVHDVARLQAIFGASFQVLPVLAPNLAANWPQLWSNSLSLEGGDALASIRWMQRASRVRAGVARMDTALMFAEALAGRPLLQLQVAQLPPAATDRWVALDAPKGPVPSRLSLVAFSPTSFAAGAPIAGFMVDEWVEVWPSAEQITGVSFQYSDPVARAPQAILLAVRPDDFPEWTLESVEGSVLEALDLAKTRSVDPDILFGTVPPLEVDENVKAFQALSENEIFVLGNDGNLWLEHAPFGTVPPTRDHIEANVSAFQALSDAEVFVLGTDGRLWLERAPFGAVPPNRQQVDANVALSPPTAPPQPPPPTTTTVPDVTDLSASLATKAIQAAKLVAKLNGPTANSLVISQSPVAGTVVHVGTTVTVVLHAGIRPK